MKVELEFIEVFSARKAHKCDYCGGDIKASNKYYKVMSRLDNERFPISIKVCNKHKIELIPLSIVLKRGHV